MDNCKVKAYYIKGCKLSPKSIFSGYVLNINDEPIIESIKRKTGCKVLTCEITNEGFEYDVVPMYSIPMKELTLGDIMVVTGNFDYITLNSRKSNV